MNVAETKALISRSVTASQIIHFIFSSSGFPVFKLSDTGHHGLPMLYSHIKTDGQPGGPMLSQAQIQKYLEVLILKRLRRGHHRLA